MPEPWLCEAGDTLRGQVNKRWPARDKASDGWIGDTSHQARPSDHNPCWGCLGDSEAVVRAVDLDRDLDPKDRTAMERLVGQLRRMARDRQDGDRLSYIIFDGAIASDTGGWVWRPYYGTNPHDHHCHVSFKPRGDHRGAPFTLPIFTAAKRRRLRRLEARLTDRIDALRRRRAKARRKRQHLGD